MTLKEFIVQDFLYIVLLLLALGACIWTIGAADDYANECNAHWANEIKDKCQCGTTNKFTKNFSIMLPIEHLNINSSD